MGDVDWHQCCFYDVAEITYHPLLVWHVAAQVIERVVVLLCWAAPSPSRPETKEEVLGDPGFRLVVRVEEKVQHADVIIHSPKIFPKSHRSHVLHRHMPICSFTILSTPITAHIR